MTIKQIVKKYTNDLREVTHIPSKEVEILIMHLLEKNVIWLHLNYDKEFDIEFELVKLIKKRATNYPLEYIIGKASFYGETFLVKEGVLIPRPETEILIDNAIEILNEEVAKNGKVKVLEIGTGTGIISVMLASLIKDIEIVAVDINDIALDLAKQNAIKHGVEDKITFIKSDLYENINNEDIFMTISNPPYIADDYKLPDNVKYEPSNALFGGKVGDELLKRIIDDTYQRKIKYLLCEMGYDQKRPLEEYFKDFSVKSHSFYKDYEDFDRGFALEFKF